MTTINRPVINRPTDSSAYPTTVFKHIKVGWAVTNRTWVLVFLYLGERFGLIWSLQVCRLYDKWFGMTYKDDIPGVKESFKKMIEAGIYKEDLYTDL